ncbi:hypothetical protein Q3G72_030740 [Acer saccharum]|nr:hypothetical protein Q3G72_030740 [Acer saccharum]
MFVFLAQQEAKMNEVMKEKPHDPNFNTKRARAHEDLDDNMVRKSGDSFKSKLLGSGPKNNVANRTVEVEKAIAAVKNALGKKVDGSSNRPSVGKVHKMGKQQWKLVDNHQASMDDELEDSEVLKALHQDMLNSCTIDKVTGEGSMYGVCDNVLDNCIEQVDVPSASNFDEVASKLKDAMEVAME